MGLSISASAAIIFTASVIVFGTVLGAMDKAEHSLIDAQRSSFDRQSDARLTHLSITNVDASNGTVSILNDGDTSLSLSDVDVMLNGSLSNDRVEKRTVNGITDTTIWLPEETLVLQLSGDLNGTAIMIIAGNGIASYA